MTAFPASITITVKTFVSDANGFITDYTMAEDFSSLPPDLAKFDPVTRKLRIMLKVRTSPGVVFTPVKPGDRLVFSFGANPGFTVEGVTGMIDGGLQWQPTNTSNGVTKITGVVTARPVAEGSAVADYSLSIKRTSDNAVGTIDPDFETDVSIGNT